MFREITGMKMKDWHKYLTNHSIPQAEFRSTLITQIDVRLSLEPTSGLTAV